MKEVIIINGVGASGKDTFVNLCKKHFPKEKIENFSSVDAVKKIAEKMGWQNDKSEKGRKFLSDLKDLWDNYNGEATNRTFRSVRYYIDTMESINSEYLVFVHIREPKKIDAFKQMLKENGITNVKTMLIKNPHVSPITSNHADRDVENYVYDIIVHNSGTLEEFDDLVRDFISKEAKRGETK